MKIAFINGSPRPGETVSGYLLNALEKRLPNCEITHGWEEPCNIYVISFPLYVDGIPSQFLRELIAREQAMPPGARVYAIANNGFYEGAQNAAALSMLRNWTVRAGLVWGQGLGIGAGTSIPLGEAMGRGSASMKMLGRALDTLAANILSGAACADLFTHPKFPRAIYMRAGDISFRLQGKKNGLTRREMQQKL